MTAETAFNHLSLALTFIPRQLAGEFNAAKAEKSSSREAIRQWQSEPIAGLSVATRLERAGAVQDFLRFYARHEKDKMEREKYHFKFFPDVVCYGRDLLESLDYGEDMKALGRQIESLVARRIADHYDIPKLSRHYPRLKEEQKRKLLQEIADHYADNARALIPGIKSPEVSLSRNNRYNMGSFHVDWDKLSIGECDAIHINARNMGNLAEDIETVCHEMTHFLTFQMTSLFAREELCDEIYIDDLSMRSLQLFYYAWGSETGMYHADPDERLAHRTGAAVRALVCLEHNLGCAEKAKRAFQSCESHLNSYAATGLNSLPAPFMTLQAAPC